MRRKQTRLLVIANPHPYASISDLAGSRGETIGNGASDEDLLCGACGAVVMQGWSIAATSKTFVVAAHMLLRCAGCRAYNVVPTCKPEAPGETWLRRRPLSLSPATAGRAAPDLAFAPGPSDGGARRRRQRFWRRLGRAVVRDGAVGRYFFTSE